MAHNGGAFQYASVDLRKDKALAQLAIRTYQRTHRHPFPPLALSLSLMASLARKDR